MAHDLARVRADFDQIATFGESGSDRYDNVLLSLVPAPAREVLEVGCGLGRLCAAMVTSGRRITGIDLSPVMIQRARSACSSPDVVFIDDDFLTHEFGDRQFDCIVTAAALHHMPFESTVTRMTDLLRARGRLIIHDMRRDDGGVDALRAYGTLAHHMWVRFIRTGRLRSPVDVRAAWIRHARDEQYLSFAEATQAAIGLLPGARVHYHAMWRYTVVWDKP